MYKLQEEKNLTHHIQFDFIGASINSSYTVCKSYNFFILCSLLRSNVFSTGGAAPLNVALTQKYLRRLLGLI